MRTRRIVAADASWTLSTVRSARADDARRRRAPSLVRLLDARIVSRRRRVTRTHYHAAAAFSWSHQDQAKSRSSRKYLSECPAASRVTNRARRNSAQMGRERTRGEGRRSLLREANVGEVRGCITYAAGSSSWGVQLDLLV